MTLDLQELTAGWDCPDDDIAARIIRTSDGEALLQLRVEMGLLQMRVNERPDGKRYRGRPTALDHVRREARVAGAVAPDDMTALHRELSQYNFRRLALLAIAEEHLEDSDRDQSRPVVAAALRDIDHCLLILRFFEQNDSEPSESLSLIPALIFHRARLLSAMLTLDARWDEAIDEAEAGATALDAFLESAGWPDDERASDPGVSTLRETARRLREDHGIMRTLREQLEDAIEADDFECAAELRVRIGERPPIRFDDPL